MINNKNIKTQSMSDIEIKNRNSQNNDILQASDLLEIPAYDIDAALIKLRSQTYKQPKKTISYRPHIYLAAAACITILITFSIFQLFFNTHNEIKKYTTAFTEKQIVNLPDGSTVNINSGSELQYTTSNWKKNRELTLKGEAFFSVKKGETFTVHTALGNISVLGTSFNIRTWDNTIEVDCYTGKVKFENRSYSQILTPGESIKLSDNKITKTNKINKKNASWLKGITELDNVPLNQALNELERQFNISIPKITRNDTITVDFPHDDPTIAIEQVLAPLEIEYSYNSKTRELNIYEN